jgi:hypothetical protein
VRAKPKKPQKYKNNGHRTRFVITLNTLFLLSPESLRSVLACGMQGLPFDQVLSTWGFGAAVLGVCADHVGRSEGSKVPRSNSASQFGTAGNGSYGVKGCAFYIGCSWWCNSRAVHVLKHGFVATYRLAYHQAGEVCTAHCKQCR